MPAAQVGQDLTCFVRLAVEDQSGGKVQLALESGVAGGRLLRLLRNRLVESGGPVPFAV